MVPLVSSTARDLASEVKVCKVDAGTWKELAARFDLPGYPTFVIFRDGAEIGRHPGAFDDVTEFHMWIRGVISGEGDEEDDEDYDDEFGFGH